MEIRRRGKMRFQTGRLEKRLRVLPPAPVLWRVAATETGETRVEGLFLDYGDAREEGVFLAGDGARIPDENVLVKTKHRLVLAAPEGAELEVRKLFDGELRTGREA